jgi:hypothetical protein
MAGSRITSGAVAGGRLLRSAPDTGNYNARRRVRLDSKRAEKAGCSQDAQAGGCIVTDLRAPISQLHRTVTLPGRHADVDRVAKMIPNRMRRRQRYDVTMTYRTQADDPNKVIRGPGRPATEEGFRLR